MPDIDGTEAALLAAAAQANRRIETCHERVACPACGAPIGSRCVRLTRAGTPTKSAATLKHPHTKRFELDGTPRR